MEAAIPEPRKVRGPELRLRAGEAGLQRAGREPHGYQPRSHAKLFILRRYRSSKSESKTGLEMVRLLELELKTYDRESARLENDHRGKFVLIRGEEIAAIFLPFPREPQKA